MIDSPQNIELIEKYLKGEITPEEQGRFDELMNDPGFAALVEDMKLTTAAVVEVELLSKKAALKVFLDKKEKTSKNRRNTGLGLVVLGLISAGSLFFMNSKEEERQSKEPFVEEITEETVVEVKQQEKSAKEGLIVPQIAPEQKEAKILPEVVQKDSVLPKQNNVTENINEAKIDSATKAGGLKKGNQKAEEKTNNCQSFAPKIETKPSCSYRPDGEVIITNKPRNASVFINGKRGGLTSLPPDVYEVKVFTAECEKTFFVEVSPKACLEEEEYVFSRTMDERVKINTSGIEGKITIFSTKTGEPIVSYFLEGGVFVWEGRGENGEYLPEGYYPAIIKTTKGEVIKTAVTITP